MADWDRRTPWRQGCAIAGDSAKALGLIPDDEIDQAIAVLISHDCDLAQDPNVEPNVEVIVGRFVALPNGNLTHAKNPRRLHLITQHQGAVVCIELVATAKRLVPKERLADHTPNGALVLSAAGRTILQHWLASRYRRSAFSDEFNRRLAATRLDKRLARILDPLGPHLVAVFFDVDEGQQIDRRGADDPYLLTINLLYSTEHDPAAAENAAQRAAGAIFQAFRERCFDSQKRAWQNIELLGCDPVSDEAMTYAMSLKLKKWNVDHLSLHTEEPQPMLSE